MNNISAVIRDLGPSQKSFYLIKAFNKMSQSVENCTSVFFERPSLHVTKPFFACMDVSFLSSFSGHAIATTVQEASILLKSNNACKKFLYLWDMEWLDQPMNFSPVCDVLLDDRLHIIARSESHAQIIENFCNKKVCGIVDDWNPDQLLTALRSCENE